MAKQEKETKSEPKKVMRKPRDLGQVLKGDQTPQFNSLKNADLLHQTFVIQSMRWSNGDFGEFAIVNIEQKGKRNTWLAGSSMVVPQLHEIENDLPVRVKLAKQGRTFYLTNP